MCNQTAPFFLNKTQSHVQIATPRTVASHGCTPPLPAFAATGEYVVSHRLSPATLLRGCSTVQPTDQPNRTARTVVPTAALRHCQPSPIRRARRQPPENSRSTPRSFTTSGSPHRRTLLHSGNPLARWLKTPKKRTALIPNVKNPSS
ncbi:hypothetical protein SLA2020_264110 [Shorea laevis]